MRILRESRIYRTKTKRRNRIKISWKLPENREQRGSLKTENRESPKTKRDSKFFKIDYRKTEVLKMNERIKMKKEMVVWWWIYHATIYFLFSKTSYQVTTQHPYRKLRSTTVRRLLMPIGVLSSYLLIDNVQNILTYLLIGTIHHITYQAILT